jgi:hypothetical protein
LSLRLGGQSRLIEIGHRFGVRQMGLPQEAFGAATSPGGDFVFAQPPQVGRKGPAFPSGLVGQRLVILDHLR